MRYDEIHRIAAMGRWARLPEARVENNTPVSKKRCHIGATLTENTLALNLERSCKAATSSIAKD
ncbi:MAG: hypothetical protein F4239_08855 [Gammaproteobacteria bacterium]|nr:hypothetical protein [Gammaproteobacteria bacterium]